MGELQVCNSAAYFTSDLIFMCIAGPVKLRDEWKYIAHHVFIIIGITICLSSGSSYAYVVCCTFWGEVSNCVQSSYLLLSRIWRQWQASDPEGKALDQGHWMRTVIVQLGKVWWVVFTAGRVYLVPVVLIIANAYAIEGQLDDKISRTAAWVMAVLPLLVCFGSFPVIANQRTRCYGGAEHYH